MSDTPHLSLPYIQQSQAQPEIAHNEALTTLDILVQPRVISLRALTAPPGSPATGDAYIPDDGATGDWVGLTDYIVYWDGSSWDSIAPQEGFSVFVQATDSVWTYHTDISPDAWVEEPYLARFQLTPSGSPLSVTPALGPSDTFCYITSSAGDLTILNPTGTPGNFDRLFIRIKTSDVRVLTFDTDYRASSTLSLPTATTGTDKTDYMMFAYNSEDAKWDYLAETFGF